MRPSDSGYIPNQDEQLAKMIAHDDVNKETPEQSLAMQGLLLLRKPFPANQISLLPKPTKKREEMDKLPKAKCKECGGWHATSNVIHLSYVGHAALTDRLLDADPGWTWEPMNLKDGLPAYDENGGLWIRLTVCGVTRLGYGHAGDKEGGDAIKEVIGDALRNAAMRFGAALELWHKGDLHVEEPNEAIEKKTAFAAPHKPADGAFDSLPVDMQTYVSDAATELGSICFKKDFKGAYERMEELAFEGEAKIALWSLLPSEARTGMVKYEKLLKGKV